MVRGKKWVWLSLFTSVLAAALIWPGRSESAIPGVDSAIGYGIDAALGAAGHSDLDAFKAWKTSRDPVAFQRVSNAVQTVRQFGRPAAGWRWDSPPQIVITEGSSDEPNAMCTGSSIYVSLTLLRVLNDRQLRAVIAHEMAHAEFGHLTERMSHAPSAVIVQFGLLLRSDWRALSRGEVDDFMRELWREGHWAMIQEMLESATLGQEMEADCLAAQSLERMRRFGVDQNPTDIIDALLQLIGIGRESLRSDPFNGARASLLESRVWETGTCRN